MPGETCLALLSKLRMQIQDGFNRRDEKYLRATFNSHKTDELITTSSLGAALNDTGIAVGKEEIDELMRITDINNDGGLDFVEFSTLVSASSPALEWVRSLPLAELVLDGLPKTDGGQNQDRLRNLCKISEKELEVACKAIMEGLFQTLKENLAAVKKAYDLLDSNAAADKSVSEKFQIITMSVGSIKDFHDGIATRIGDQNASTFKFLHCREVFFLFFYRRWAAS
jgi:hypothetical protein